VLEAHDMERLSMKSETLAKLVEGITQEGTLKTLRIASAIRAESGNMQRLLLHFKNGMDDDHAKREALETYLKTRQESVDGLNTLVAAFLEMEQQIHLALRRRRT